MFPQERRFGRRDGVTDARALVSGVPGLVVVRILVCISTIVESSAVPGDFSVAFMSTPLHDAEFIEPPIEAESDSRYVWKLRKASRRHLNCFQTTCQTSWLISLVPRSVLLCPPLFITVKNRKENNSNSHM